VQGSADNRESIRLPATWRARLMASNGPMVDARTMDVSASGLGVLSPNPFAAQGLVQIALQVPTPQVPGKFQVVTGQGKVVFQVLQGDAYRLGLQWTELQPAYRDVITHGIERLQTRKA
jgi:c-di-GMP-binding flagellar brake protein YcgR